MHAPAFARLRGRAARAAARVAASRARRGASASACMLISAARTGSGFIGRR